MRMQSHTQDKFPVHVKKKRSFINQSHPIVHILATFHTCLPKNLTREREKVKKIRKGGEVGEDGQEQLAKQS